MALLTLAVFCNSCPGTIAEEDKLYTGEYFYPNYNDRIAIGIHQSSASNCMFPVFNGKLQGKNQTRILRIEEDLSPTWTATFQGFVYPNAITVSDTHSAIVVAIEDSDECPIVFINQADGTSQNQMSITTLDTCETLTLSADGEFFVISGLSSDGKGTIALLNSTDFSHVQSIKTGLSNVKDVRTRLTPGDSDLSLVIIGQNTSPSEHYTHYDFNYNTNSLRWGKGVYCSSTCTSLGEVRTVVHQDTLYTLTMQAGEVIFYGLSANDGSTVQSVLASSIPETNVAVSDLSYSSTYNTIFIIVSYEYGFIKFDYDIDSSSIVSAYQHTTFVSSGIIDFNSVIHIAGANIPTKDWYVWEMYERGNNQWNDQLLLEVSTYSFATEGSYSFSDDTLSFTNPANTVSLGGSLSVAPNLNGGATTSNAPSVTIGQELSSQMFTISGGETNAFTLSNHPCTLSSGTIVTASVFYENDTLASWASVDTSSYELTVEAPEVDADETYQLYISYSIESATFQQIVSLEVSGNQPEGEQETAAQDNVNEGETHKAVSEQGMQTQAITVASVSAILTIGNTLMTGSSMQNVWTLINQYQLFMMLPYLNSNLGLGIREVIESLDFMILNIDEVMDESLSKFKMESLGMHYQHEYEDYIENGIDSGSYFVSQFLGFLFVAFLISLHALLILMSCCVKEGKCASVLTKILNWVNQNMYFTIGMEFILFSFFFSFDEICRFLIYHHSPGSFVISLWCMFSWTGYVIYLVCSFIKFRSKNIPESQKFLYKDTKNNSIARFYQLTFVVRRLTVIVVVVLFRNANVYFRLSVFTLIQLLSLGYICIAQPFKRAQDNFINATHDAIYSIACMLVIDQVKAEAESFSGILLIYMIIFNGAVICFIQLIFLIGNLLKKFSSTKKIVVKPAPTSTNEIAKPKRMRSTTAKFYSAKTITGGNLETSRPMASLENTRNQSIEKFESFEALNRLASEMTAKKPNGPSPNCSSANIELDAPQGFRTVSMKMPDLLSVSMAKPTKMSTFVKKM